MKRNGVAGLALLALALPGCLGEHVTFEHLLGADRVEVTTDHGALVGTVRDAGAISSVQALVNRHDSGWTRSATRGPVLQVSFYRGGHQLGGFGLGRDFLTTPPGAGLMARSIPVEEAAEIRRALGVSPASD